MQTKTAEQEDISQVFYTDRPHMHYPCVGQLSKQNQREDGDSKCDSHTPKKPLSYKVYLCTAVLMF